MKIFWSWQSDTPGKTGRHFIRRALLDAIRELKDVEDVEEPNERENKENLHLDHDRQGIAGSPDLVKTIFGKIELSAVFVADITPVSKIQPHLIEGVETREKRNMNPNVAIELGYAMHALGDNFLMVLNTFYGDRQFIPFDLAGRGGPIMFFLPPDADNKTLSSESLKLKSQLVTALRPFLKSNGFDSRTTPFPETLATLTAATFFELDEPLAVFGEEYDKVKYACSNSNGLYLRVIPAKTPPAPFYCETLYDEIRRVKLRSLSKPNGIVAMNRFGAINIEPRSNTGGEIKSFTQVFTNGEIWGFAPDLIIANEYGQYVPGKLFESSYREALRAYVSFIINNLKMSPPFTVEAGAVGIKDMQIMVGPTALDRIGPFLNNEFKVRLVLNEPSDTAIDDVLLKIFEELYRTTGYSRPKNQFGFPLN